MAQTVQNANRDPENMRELEEKLQALFLETLESSLGKAQPLPEVLYHYTSEEALINILQTSIIWATHEHFMNDPSEGEHGRGIALNLVREKFFHDERLCGTMEGRLGHGPMISHGEFHADAYIASFSAACDLLSQWRAYSNNGLGYCIGFRPADTPFDRRLRSFEAGTAYMEVQYDKDVYRNSLDAFLDRGVEFVAEAEERGVVRQGAINRLGNWFRLLVQITQRNCKQPGYSEEREWRLVHVRRRAEFPYQVPDTNEVRFRSAKGQVVPYFPISMGRTQDAVIPLESIWLGPAANGDQRELAVSMLLQSIGLNPDRLIHRSATQYRV